MRYVRLATLGWREVTGECVWNEWMSLKSDNRGWVHGGECTTFHQEGFYSYHMKCQQGSECCLAAVSLSTSISLGSRRTGRLTQAVARIQTAALGQCHANSWCSARNNYSGLVRCLMSILRLSVGHHRGRVWHGSCWANPEDESNWAGSATSRQTGAVHRWNGEEEGAERIKAGESRRIAGAARGIPRARWQATDTCAVTTSACSAWGVIQSSSSIASLTRGTWTYARRRFENSNNQCPIAICLRF